MNNDKESEEWEGVQFMIDASTEILEKNYEKAILILRQGINEGLFESNNVIDYKRLLHTLGLLITSVEMNLKDTFSIEFDKKNKVRNLENSCSFCGASSVDLKILVKGAYGNICSSCIQHAFHNLAKYNEQAI